MNGWPGAPQTALSQEGASDRELAAARGRVQRLESELGRLASQRETVVQAFETADVELALRRQQLAVLERRGELLDELRGLQQAEVERLDDALREGRRLLRDRVVSLYRIGPLSYNRLLLGAESTDDVLVGYQLVTYLAARDRDLVRNVRGTLGSLRASQLALEATSRQLEQLRLETASAAEVLAAQQEERRQALRRIDRRAETQRITLAEAERSMRALERTLEQLIGLRTESVPVGFATARGSLPWPATGDVVGGFGRRRHPIYDTYTLSRGIEIGAEEGKPVRAVFDGRVVFADWYSGYGLLVILGHGGEYFTLYGHLSSVAVLVNERVQAASVIGRVGETGSLTGPNLYFEVREGTDALDPLRWLVNGSR